PLSYGRPRAGRIPSWNSASRTAFTAAWGNSRQNICFPWRWPMPAGWENSEREKQKPRSQDRGWRIEAGRLLLPRGRRTIFAVDPRSSILNLLSSTALLAGSAAIFFQYCLSGFRGVGIALL